MGAIKNFFWNEICAMQDGEDLILDDEYMENKWKEHEAAEAALINMEEELKEVENSGVPKHLHSKF